MSWRLCHCQFFYSGVKFVGKVRIDVLYGVPLGQGHTSPATIRLSRMRLTATNALAYYDTKLTTAVKSLGVPTSCMLTWL
jgi:hypothetical protein